MKHTVYFTRYLWILPFSAVVLLLGCTALWDPEPSPGFFIGMLLLSLLGVFLHCIKPYACSFDRQGFTIRYPFGFYESGTWKDVKNIYTEPETWGSLLDICWFTMYHGTVGKKSFFTQSAIPCTRKVRDIVRKYWDPKFTG